MHPETFRTALNKILKIAGKSNRIALHGNGEPLLSPYFFDCLDIAKEMEFTNIDFSTNGLLITDEVCEKLKQYAGVISWVRVSVNTLKRELFNRINTGSDYDLVMANTQKLINHNLPFTVCIQLLKTNDNQDESINDFKNAFSGYFNVKVTDYTTFSNLVDNNGLNNDDHRTCPYGNDFINIHWDGDMNGCCIDVTKQQIYGNVMTDDILNDKFFQSHNESQAGNLTNLPTCKICRRKQ